MTKIEEILKTDENLYEFLKEEYKAFGCLPERILTVGVLERLFIYENIPDSLIGELFGLNSRQIARRRYKHDIKWKAPKYRKERFSGWFEEKAKEMAGSFTKEEIAYMKERIETFAELEEYWT